MNGLSRSQRLISAVLKATVFLSAVLGTYLSYDAGRDSFMGGANVFMFFTIQSNIAAAVICFVGLFLISGKKPIPVTWYIIKYVGTVSITLTGVVFCFVLAPTMGGEAWNVQNILTHVVVPIAAVADFFVTGINSRIKKRNVFWVTVPPLLYTGFAAVCYINGLEFAPGINYPYFFLNWGSPAGAFGFINELPFMGCAWWIITILIMLVAVGLFYLLLTDLLKQIFHKT